ncbi:37S ribosomal protein S22 [Oleoguttula sp. CCFEE 5521]
MVADEVPDWQSKVKANFRVAARGNARLGNNKTKTGCITCRRRRVKCDEAAPSCQRCAVAGRNCEGYGTGTSQVTTPASITRIVHSPSSAPVIGEDGHMLQYFQTWAAQRIVGEMDVDFWSRTIMQLCHTERWALQGALAISSLYRHSSAQPLDGRRTDQASQGIKHYTQSLASAREQLGSGRLTPIMALTSCIMFICFETLRDRVDEAVALFLQGLRMLENLPSDTAAQTAVLRIRDMFTRLLLLVATFGWPRVKEVRLRVENSEAVISFATLSDARSALFTATAQLRADPAILLAEKWQDGAISLGWLTTQLDELHEIGDAAEYNHVTTRQQHYVAKLNHWHAVFQSSLLLSRTSESYHLMQLHCYIFKIWLNLLLQHRQSAFDAHFSDFLTALHHATCYVEAKAHDQVPMTFELGAIPMLFAIAFRCRVPSIRRRALAVLRRAPRRECTYDAELSRALAERIVAFEEEGLGLPDPALFQEGSESSAELDDVVIGEERRVHMVWSVKDHTGRSSLRVSRFCPDSAGRWRLIEEQLRVTGILEGVEVERGLYPFYPVRKPVK